MEQGYVFPHAQALQSMSFDPLTFQCFRTTSTLIHPSTKSPVTFETLLRDDPHQTSSLKIGPSLSSVNRPVAPQGRPSLPVLG
ncbi:hypothetical protein TNIN_435221 [Trichonephila inaurata madagascariensis]|uniref:Uncharacterized protein n=1 Tax=Trichonephila inaurata madagascariensis TaxID=2747483 RepID=A0A8X6X2R6_9ARAC|nr:hypothetical protein TNIN_435221 [Trichonephila inaurata madagascariensis]